MFNRLFFLCFALTMLFAFSVAPATPPKPKLARQIIVPGTDRFAPFVITIHVGDSVEWINQDTDDHTIVGVSVLSTTDHRTVNRLLRGTDSNGGQPGTVTLTFNQAGRFVYHCRFHSHLGAGNQPVAPGPRGGIKDSKGNFGVPMMGFVEVLLPGQ